MSTPENRRHIIVGHANTIHDPAICVAEGDALYAEAFERHMQCKRAWEANLYYSSRPLLAALSDLQIWPLREANIRVLSTWNTAELSQWSAPDQIVVAPVRAQAERIAAEWRFEHLLK